MMGSNVTEQNPAMNSIHQMQTEARALSYTHIQRAIACYYNNIILYQEVAGNAVGGLEWNSKLKCYFKNLVMETQTLGKQLHLLAGRKESFYSLLHSSRFVFFFFRWRSIFGTTKCSIYQNFKIVNINITKDELFDSFIIEFTFFHFL